jgi:uncharacterized protein YndB with AHSA1/START domain
MAYGNSFGEGELVINRLFDAPRDLVFAAWTDPKQVAHWWGPSVFTNPACEIDARLGGTIHIVMRAPDGTEHVTKGVFREFVPSKTLAFTNNAHDADGRLLLEGYTTVTFADEDGKTRMRLVTKVAGKVALAPQMLAGMDAGWNQSLDKLAELLAAL